ncbi:MAG TPA: adenylate/guanylate cyclase domain-containing protein [Aestuariivirgaceae bacterium]|nr:adenylate/guanylate cyclase domain-containing protein [Aestuariivirgaceae bacterium]
MESASSAKRRGGRWSGWLAYRALLLVVALTSIAGLAALRVTDPFVVRAARETAFDLLQRASPRSYAEAPVGIVDIDESSLEQLGQWPWPRSRLAELVERLHAAGAVTVVFDFIFAEPDRLSPRRLAEDPQILERLSLGPEGLDDLPDTDAIFADMLERGYVVIGFGASARPGPAPPVKAGFAYTGEDPVPYVMRLRGSARVLPELAEAADGIGSVNLGEDFSLGVVRRTPLLWTDGERLYPSLIGEALRVAQGAQTYVVHADPRTGGVVSVRIGAFEVPTEPTGELYLHFTPPRAERYVSAADVFDDARLRELVPVIEGRIMLIGTSAPGLFDVRKTPLGNSVPGVEVHAQAIEQIINGQFLLRHDWTRGLELLALALASLIVTVTTLWSGARMALLFGGVVAAMIAAGAWDAFGRWGVLIDPSFALGGGLAVWFVAMAFRYLSTERERREIRGAFAHYVHPTVLREIERNRRQVRLGGENCELTVLFTDVRGFTQLSEQLEPEEVVAFLNTLFGRLSGEVTRQGGVIDKFIGDSLMAFWNAPLRQEDHARRACAAALGMRAAVHEMNARGTFGLPAGLERRAPVAIGAGINTGWACVGNVGSAERLNYSAIGDGVNVAASAEAACKDLGYDLVVARSTAALVPDFAFLEAGAVRLKGKTQPVPLMILVGDAEVNASPRFSEFAQRYRSLIEALRDGRAGAAEESMADCRSLAAALDPSLLSYLDRVPARRDDFRPMPHPRIGLASG